jgi:hypothetical protein
VELSGASVCFDAAISSSELPKLAVSGESRNKPQKQRNEYLVNKNKKRSVRCG